jgi:transposase
MYIDIVPNRNSPPAVLLREGHREGKKVHKRTVANLSHWPTSQVEALRRVLKGETLVSVDEVFEIASSLPHGHVEAVLSTLRGIGLDQLISSRPCRERDLVVAMIVERLLHGASKLASTRLWHTTTLAEELDVSEADEDDLYEAMLWLLARQKRIEKKLADRHLLEGAMVFYDLSSSYYYGRTCPLAHFGHSRDGKKGLPIIVYGLLADGAGRPISVEVYPGNRSDPTTVPDQVQTLRERFELRRVVLVGDRGMLSNRQIELLKALPGLGWITALRSRSIRELVEGGDLQLSLFDQRNLVEFSSPEYPGERLVGCYNPLLAHERNRKRQELLEATEQELVKIEKEVARRTRTPLSEANIGKKVGRVLNRFKMAKHFDVTIEAGRMSWQRNQQAVETEEALDGIYVIRTSEPAAELASEDTVRQYKNLGRVEEAFRCFKSIDIRVRPIRHRTEEHVRAHIFLCMLAYYVEFHMRQALAPVLFDDEHVEEDRKHRDPVKPAKPSISAELKRATKRTQEGFAVHSFDTLLEALSTRCRVICRFGDSEFTRLTPPTEFQQRVTELLNLKVVPSN